MILPSPFDVASPPSRRRISSTTSATAISSWRASASRASMRSVRIFTRSRRFSRGPVRNVGARGPPLLDDALGLQLAVGPRHRIRIDHQPLRQGPDRRQLLARHQSPRRHQVLHLVDDLQVDRHAVAGRDVDLHRGTIPRRNTFCINTVIQSRAGECQGVAFETRAGSFHGFLVRLSLEFAATPGRSDLGLPLRHWPRTTPAR